MFVVSCQGPAEAFTRKRKHVILEALGYQEGGQLAHPGYTPELVLPGSLAIGFTEMSLLHI